MDLSAVIAAMGAVVLERVARGRFERRSAAPSWWRACFERDEATRQPLVIDDLFPFLAVFMPEAERVWSSADAASIASEPWTETDARGHDIHLEATATRVGQSAVLVIARNDQAFLERQLLLQRARELRLTYDALMTEIESKDILLHTIVHDLAAPLHSIVGSLSLLREIELPPDAVRWADLAVQASSRQRELIEGILNVFVAEHGTDESTEPGGVDLRRAIERAVSESEPIARQRQVELVTQLVASSTIVGDETRLTRVLTNLLDNAIRHSPAGTQIRVTTLADNGSVRLTVDDEGPGVPTDVLPRLFQKLARNPRGSGTGLGLYFCRITVEQWGGGIGYEPRPRGGARFWIRLPLAAERDRHRRRPAHG